VLFLHRKARFTEEIMPPSKVGIAIKAPNAVACIRGPVHKADTRPRQNPTSLVILDDNPSPRNPACLLEKAQGMFLVMENIRQKDIIERVIVMGYYLSVIGVDWNHTLFPGAGFQTPGFQAIFHSKRPGKSPTTTTNIEQGLTRNEPVSNQAEKSTLAPGVYRCVKLAEKGLHSASVAPRDF
tara:strand:- start:2544 stop:3089 length:546 start_codon:yes stop_codon:yes gene_type:complete